MHWFWWIIVAALGVFALRSLWAAYEALRHEPRQASRAGFELLWAGVDVLLILWILGVIP